MCVQLINGYDAANKVEQERTTWKKKNVETYFTCKWAEFNTAEFDF